MAEEYNVIQEYWFEKDNPELVCLPITKDMKFRQVYPTGPDDLGNPICKAYASPFHVYACIKDSKLGRPYIKWEKCKRDQEGFDRYCIYILWHEQNVLYKVFDYCRLPLSDENLARIAQLVMSSKEIPPIDECYNSVDKINERMARLKR